MSHGRRKPRQPRPITPDTLQLAANRAAKLKPDEIDEVMAPIDDAYKSLREGVSTEDQWVRIASSVNVAQSIEKQGVVRGLGEHLHAAELALAEVRRRAMSSGEWRQTALYYQELDSISTAIDLHRYQLEQLGRGEALRAINHATAEIASTGGRVLRIGAMQEEMSL